MDVYVSQRRDIASARAFFTAALAVQDVPSEVATDRAPALANVIDELVPAALHNTGQYQNNRVEGDHGRLKARLRPMRGLKTHRTASVVIRGPRLPPELATWPLRAGRRRQASILVGHRIRRAQTRRLNSAARAHISPQPGLRSNNATEPVHRSRPPRGRRQTSG